MDKLSMELDESHGVAIVRFEAKIPLEDLTTRTAEQIAVNLGTRLENEAENLIAGFQENAKKG